MCIGLLDKRRVCISVRGGARFVIFRSPSRKKGEKGRERARERERKRKNIQRPSVEIVRIGDAAVENGAKALRKGMAKLIVSHLQRGSVCLCE